MASLVIILWKPSSGKDDVTVLQNIVWKQSCGKGGVAALVMEMWKLSCGKLVWQYC